MKISDINPHIRYAKTQYSHTANATEPRICYDCRIFYIEKATGTVFVNGEEYNITNKMALYFPPKTKYLFRLDRDDIKIVVTDFDLTNEFSHIKESLSFATEKDFDEGKVLKYDITESLREPIICELPEILPLLKQCTENFMHKRNLYREHSSALLKMCLLRFIEQGPMKNPYSDLCEQVMVYVHENYHKQTLSNSEIGDKFSYHPYHLSRIMKEGTGKTLHQYILWYRLRIAKNLLMTTDKDIDEIAWKSGFASSSHFIKFFRESVGMTPKKFRQQQIFTEL